MFTHNHKFQEKLCTSGRLVARLNIPNIVLHFNCSLRPNTLPGWMAGRWGRVGFVARISTIDIAV